MNYNEIMARELKRAETGAKLEKVPDSRKATPESLLKLERQIADAIECNDRMRNKSFINNS